MNENKWPETVRLRDAGMHETEGRRILTTVGMGYEKEEYIRKATHEARIAELEAQSVKDEDGFVTGVCKFTIKHRVTTYTSGNELRGDPVHFGDFPSDRDARQALADDGFTNGQFGWRKGYTDANIREVTEYSDLAAPDKGAE